MDLNEIAAFARVVSEASFTRAARALGLPKSTVSERVARLESQLGVRLLERTTRSVKPTPAGAAYFARVVNVVAELDRATADVAESQRAARGLVRVGAPTLFTRMFLVDACVAFLREHPAVEIDLVAADRRLSLVEEGLDVAVSVGKLEENAVQTTFARARRVVVASPDYVARRGVPQTPAELASHDCVITTQIATPSRHATWAFGEEKVIVSGKLIVTSVDLAVQAVLGGAGVTIAPSLLVQPEIDAGRLVALLARHSAGTNDLVLVHATTRSMPFRVKLFVDFVLDRFHIADEVPGLERIARRRLRAD
ncbi:MAG TPA: LysR family transcriptional regulator [Labilithrix sp.]